MRRTNRKWNLVLAGGLAFLVACGGPSDLPDGGGTDAGDVDAGVADAGASDAGETPDAGDPPVPPEVTSIDPVAGQAGTAFVLTGTGFVSGASVRFGSAAVPGALVESSTRITGAVPARAESDGETVDVTVTNPDQQSDVLAGAFTYVTQVDPPVQWCRLLLPEAERGVWADEPVAGSVRVYHPGNTEAEGAGAGLTVEFGSGSSAVAPESWTGWSRGTFSRQDGNDDVFDWEGLVPEGRSRFAARARLAAGPWVYCDLDGLEDGFSLEDVPLVVVRAVPSVTSVEPAAARTGATVTVRGTGFVAEGRVYFGDAQATDYQPAQDGRSATVTVPTGAGEVRVVLAVERRTSAEDVRFTIQVDPDELRIDAVTPRLLSVVPESSRIVLTGVGFGEGVKVRVGTVLLDPASVTATRLEVDVPRQAAGEVALGVEFPGTARTAAFPAGLSYRKKHTPLLDGTIGEDWPELLLDSTNTVESEWGANYLYRLYLAYDDTHLHVGIHGATEAQNAVVGAIGDPSLASGLTDLASLTDYTGELDRILSGVETFSSTVTGTKFQFGFGALGSCPNLAQGSLDARGGVRSLVRNAGDLPWVVSGFARSGSGLEFSIPWATSAADDQFLVRPVAGKVDVFVRLAWKDLSGALSTPNQSLPPDPNVGLTGADRRVVSRVASLLVE